MKCRQVVEVFGAIGLLVGCTGHEPAPAPFNEPIGVQMLRAAPELKDQRFSNLLAFEFPNDTVFVTGSGAAVPDSRRAHTGRRSLRISTLPAQIDIKLASLLAGRRFPGDWTLAGAYFYSDQPAEVTVVYRANQVTELLRSVSLPSRAWTAVMVDLSSAGQPEPQGPVAFGASLSFLIGGNGPVWCDDVTLIDNTQWLVGGPDATDDPPWSIQRRGLHLLIDSPARFSIDLASDGAATSWSVDEANEMRARFSSGSGRKRLTIYPDGRSYWDGEYRPLAGELRAERSWRQQHDSPAAVVVPEAMGRVDRRTPGDGDNDGYNECRAAYQIVASGARLDVTLEPRSVSVLRPLLEIANLPAGKVLVTVEGRLVERSLRLPDETLLAEIPTLIDRPTTVNVRVQ